MTRSSLKHLLLVSSLALGMVFGAPYVFPAKAGCGCGNGTPAGAPSKNAARSDRKGWKPVTDQKQQDQNAGGLGDKKPGEGGPGAGPGDRPSGGQQPNK